MCSVIKIFTRNKKLIHSLQRYNKYCVEKDWDINNGGIENRESIPDLLNQSNNSRIIIDSSFFENLFNRSELIAFFQDQEDYTIAVLTTKSENMVIHSSTWLYEIFSRTRYHRLFPIQSFLPSKMFEFFN